MFFQFYFKKMESSEALKSLCRRKLCDVIERFLGDSGHVHISFSVEKSEQRVSCHFHTWNGAILNASGASENMYASIDLVAQKIETQLARHKMRTRRRERLPFSEERLIKFAGLQGSYFDPEAFDEDIENFDEVALPLVH